MVDANLTRTFLGFIWESGVEVLALVRGAAALRRVVRLMLLGCY